MFSFTTANKIPTFSVGMYMLENNHGDLFLKF